MAGYISSLSQVARFVKGEEKELQAYWNYWTLKATVSIIPVCDRMVECLEA